MPSYAPRTVVAVLAVAMTGCASAPLPQVNVPAPALGGIDARFAPGATVLSGIQPLLPSPAIEAGDHVLLGMTIRRSGVEQTRFIEIHVRDPLSHLEPVHFQAGLRHQARLYFSPRIAATVRLLDANGRVLKEGEGGFASEFLSAGLIDLSRLLAKSYDVAATIPPGGTPPPRLPLDERMAMERGFTTILAFTAAMNNNSRGIFRSILMDFIGTGGLLRALFFRSFSISIDGRPVVGTVRLPGIDEDLPACTLPLSAAFGDTTVARCMVTAVRPVSPLTLTGGIVRVDLTRPSAPDDRITIQLLAARRGRP